MKNRMISIVLALFIIFSLLPSGAFAAEIVDSGAWGEDVTWTLDSNGVLTITGIGYTPEYTMLASPFEDDLRIKKVVISEGIIGLGAGLFYYCAALTRVSLPSTLRFIGANVFSYCTALNNVMLPAATEDFFRAFRGCANLTDFNVDEKNENFCSNGTGVIFTKDMKELVCAPAMGGTYTVPAGVTCIGNSAFYENDKLTHVILPDGVETISQSAFERCTSLKTAKLADSITFLGDGAFSGCSALTDINLPTGLASLDYYVFSSCASLDHVTIPEGVTKIDNSAFADCTSLSAMTIPASVTELMSNSFRGCTSLPEFKVAEGNTSYTVDDGVLYNKDMTDLICCPAGKSGTYAIAEGTTFVSSAAFDSCAKLTSVTIPEGVETLSGDAFFGCSGLTELSIPASLIDIGEYAFYGCSGLQRFLVDENNTVYSSDAEGVLFNKTQTSLLCYPSGKIGAYTIAEGVERLGDYAFAGCGTLTAITMPNSLTDMGNYTFEDCISLGEIHFSESLTHIGGYVFASCNALRHVEIPEGVTTLGIAAFANCEALQTVVLPSTVTRLDPFCFSSCMALQGVYCKGPAPGLSTIFFEGVFQYWDDDLNAYANLPKLTIYYIEGQEGWTTPTWNYEEYPTKVWDPDRPFDDVSVGAWYDDAVTYAVEHELMNGMSFRTFAPESTMTRAMLVTVLWRYAGSPTGYENTFTDLTQDWYMDAVAWAAANSIVNGVGGGKFDPDGSITREQMATILFRYCEKVGIETSARANLSIFPDGDKVSDWAKDALSWANAEGLITGSGENGTVYLLPLGQATRAQVATILMRFIENVAK